MTTLYLDTSALAKIYVREVGSTRVRREVDAADSLVTSVISIPEFGSAVGRRLRMGDLTDEGAQKALTDFRSDIASYFVVNVSRDLADSALEIASNYSLRGSDAIHVATALDLFAKVVASAPSVLMAADRRLLAVAEQLGLTAVDVSTSE